MHWIEIWNRLRIRSIGTSTEFLTLKVLTNLELLLLPLPTQQQIADILSAVDRKIEAEESKKKALEELFKTLLNNLMTGKIRVKGMVTGGEQYTAESTN